MTESLYWSVMVCTLALFLALLYVDFLEHFFTRRFHFRLAGALPAVTMAAAYACVLLRARDVMAYGLALLAFSLAVALLFYREREGGNVRLLLPPVYVAILLLVKHLVPLVLLAWAVIRPADLDATDLTNLMVRILTIVLFFVIVKLMERTSRPHVQQIPWVSWLLLLVVPASTILTFVSRGDLSGIGSGSGLLMTVQAAALIGLLFSNLIVFRLFENSLKVSEYRYRLGLLRQQMELQKKFYGEQRESFEATRRKLHDAKNAVVYLELLVRENRMQELQESLARYRQEMDQCGPVGFTGNGIFDAVLYQKYSAARAQGIDVKVVSDIPPALPIDPIDICSVLGNALDNAIEACRELAAGKLDGGPAVEVRISCERGYLRIGVKNPVARPPEAKGGVFPSTKADPRSHGLGIRSMETVAQKYDGNLHISVKNGCFYLTVILAI